MFGIQGVHCSTRETVGKTIKRTIFNVGEKKIKQFLIGKQQAPVVR